MCGKNWSYNEALVVCKQLEYFDAIKFTTGATSGEGYGRLMIDNVTRTGKESELHNCSFVQWHAQNCSDGTQAIVVCGK